jgi:hypothetical protein
MRMGTAYDRNSAAALSNLKPGVHSAYGNR